MLKHKDILSLIVLVLSSHKLVLAGSLYSDEPIKDFGEVKEGELLKHTFEVKNISKNSVFINKIFSSCGCLVSSKKQLTLEPDESTSIPIEFKTKGYGGRKFQKEITIFFVDGKKEGLFRLKIKGDVEGIKMQNRILIIPQNRSIFNEQDKEHYFYMRAPLVKDLELNLKTPNFIKAEIEKIADNETLKITKWRIAFSISQAINNRTKTAIVVNSNVPSFETLSVPIHIEPKPLVTADPPILFFEKSKEIKTYTKELTIIFLKDSQRETEKHDNFINTESVKTGYMKTKSIRDLGAPLITVEPSNQCISVRLTKISPDLSKLLCQVSLKDCPSSHLDLRFLAGKTCILKVPICFLSNN